MVTTVGHENLIEDLVENVLLLKHDAIAAYEPTIERLENPSYKQQISEFREDHLRHVSELEKMASLLKLDPPKGGDMKQSLTTGKIALAGLVGDTAIIKATKPTRMIRSWLMSERASIGKRSRDPGASSRPSRPTSGGTGNGQSRRLRRDDGVLRPGTRRLIAGHTWARRG